MRTEYRKHQQDPMQESYQTKSSGKQGKIHNKILWARQILKPNQDKLKKKFKKVNGNYKHKTVPPLIKRRMMITQPNMIVEIFADHYTKMSNHIMNHL